MNYYNEIKTILINNEAYKQVKDYYKNRNDLMSYYNVGKLLIDAQGGEKRAKYGNHLIKEYSIKLTKELGKKYSERNLRNMRQFFLIINNYQIWNAMRSKLTWTHYRILMAIKDMDKIIYYTNIAEKENISYRKLEERIKSKEYERLSDETKDKLINNNDQIWNAMRSKLTWTHYRILMAIKDMNKIIYYTNIAEKENISYRKLEEKIKSKEYERLSDETKDKLINNNEVNIKDNILNPIIINTYNKDINRFNENALKEFILNDISRFMEQLGSGYSFIKDEYPILLGDRYNYIDLLLFNINFNCYVCIELKVTELKKEHIGQIETYMHYIDSNLKSLYQDNTIGIIICKKDNKYIIEYCSDSRVIRTTYQLD